MADGATPGLGHNRGPTLRSQQLAELSLALAAFKHDPLGLVLFLFPWGVPGTSLEGEDGPDEWQREELDEIGRRLRKEPFKTIRRCTASGHGIGKSAEVSWLILWAMLTFNKTKVVATANTDTQLRSKTWAELAKWWALACIAHPLLRDLFKYTATSLHAVGNAEVEKQWRADAIPWSKSNPTAFQGLHNTKRRILLIFDEASEIDDIIWEVAEGAMTDKDTEIIFCAYANPTKPTGRFKENAVGRFRGRWQFTQIDSRDVARTDKEELNSWVQAWGIDSDFVRVRVTGQFPRVGSMQLISTEAVSLARERPALYNATDPLVAGLDVARYGDDASVLRARRGRDARTLPPKKWREVDTMTLAAEAAGWCETYKPDALFIDCGGLGVGVYDRLIQLRVPNVYGVNFGGPGSEVEWNGMRVRCANHRAAMWCAMREWLAWGSIDTDTALEQDLVNVQYGYTGPEQAILLEPKEAMKKRGLASPDDGDALAMTFSMYVPPRAEANAPTSPLPRTGVTTDYDTMKDAW